MMPPFSIISSLFQIEASSMQLRQTCSILARHITRTKGLNTRRGRWLELVYLIKKYFPLGPLDRYGKFTQMASEEVT